MPLTVRLNPTTERALNALAKRKQRSRSDIVREAIERFGAEESLDKAGDRPFDDWLDVIGVVRLGARDPKHTTGQQFADMIRRRAPRPRAR